MTQTPDTRRITQRKLDELEEDIQREQQAPLEPDESEESRQVTLHGMQILARQLRQELNGLPHDDVNGSPEADEAAS
ncbi:MAG: hypothetical protein HYX51_10840 [Chloroflexi bacterium]|nr:hypothetical protein [Chloroflexota bacterium]